MKKLFKNTGGNSIWTLSPPYDLRGSYGNITSNSVFTKILDKNTLWFSTPLIHLIENSRKINWKFIFPILEIFCGSKISLYYFNIFFFHYNKFLILKITENGKLKRQEAVNSKCNPWLLDILLVIEFPPMLITMNR